MRSIVVVTLSICPFAIALFPESKPADSPGSRAQSPDTQADEGSKEVEVFPSHPALYKATRETKQVDSSRVSVRQSSIKAHRIVQQSLVFASRKCPTQATAVTFLSSIDQPAYETTGLSRE